MNADKTSLMIWMILGFVFIQALDSILYLLNYLVYFGTLSLGIPSTILIFLLPIFAIATYWVIFIWLKKTSLQSEMSARSLHDVLKKYFLALFILAIFLRPLTHKLIGLFHEYTEGFLAVGFMEIIKIQSWLIIGIGVGRWTVLIALGLLYLNKQKQFV